MDARNNDFDFEPIGQAIKKARTESANLSKKSQYLRKYMSYGMLGLVEKWIQNHFCELPEDLTKICN